MKKKYLYWFWEWVSGYFIQKPPTYKLIDISKEPNNSDIQPKKVYHVGLDGNKWCIIFLCPCGCQDIIRLNTLPSPNPTWKIEWIDRKLFSIYPSINRQKGCHSHFFIRNSQYIVVPICERYD